MRRTLLAALAVTVTLPAADRATAQFTCRGYREGRCRASWFTQAGYYYRLDRDIGGVHLFTWEIGPQMALLERNVTLGVTAWLAADFDNNARMGGKFRATRPAGPADLDVGIGLFLIDLNDNVPSLVAHAGLRFADRVLLSSMVEVISKTTRETRVAWYIGVAHQRHPEGLSRPEVLFSIAAWVAAVAISIF